MKFLCRIFGHKTVGPLPVRCSRCDVPVGVGVFVDGARAYAFKTLHDSVIVSVYAPEWHLIQALNEIAALAIPFHRREACTRCKDPSCMASRAIDEYGRLLRDLSKGGTP